MSNQKSILVAGGHPHQLHQGVCEAFRQAGWKVHFFDLSPESPWHRPFVKPIRKLIHNLRLKRHPETFDNTPLSNLGWRSRRWWQYLQEVQPDIVLLLRGNRIDLSYLHQARKAGIPLFCWMLEPEKSFPAFEKEIKAGVYREVFVYRYKYVEEVKKRGLTAIFFPHRTNMKPDASLQKNRQRTYDWCFLGNHSPCRETFIRAVAEHFPNGFLAGVRWNHLKTDPVLHTIYRPVFYGEAECQELYLNTCIGLDIPGEWNSEDNGLSMRVPELLTCGCHVMTPESEEIERLPWKVTNQLFTFTSEMDLIVKMQKELRTFRESSLQEENLSSLKSVSGYGNLVEQITQSLDG